MDARRFYDELAPDYDALHADWPSSVRRQGEVLDALIRSELGDVPQRVLDCACGIGTQAIGLALRGHDVLATDLSPGVRRAGRARGGGDGRDARDRRRRLHAPEPSRSRAPSPACWPATTPSRICTPTRTSPASPPACARKLEPGGLALVSLRDYAPLVAERARRPSRARRAGHDLVPGLGVGRRRPHATSWRSSRCAARASDGRRPAAAPGCARCCATSCAARSTAAGLRGRALAYARGDRLLPADRDWPTAAEERSYRPGHALLATRRPPRPRRHQGLERPPPGIGAPRTRRGRDHADDRRSRLRDAARGRRGGLRLDARRPHALRVLAGRRDAARRDRQARLHLGGPDRRGEPRRLLPRRAGRDVLGLRLRARRG